MNIFEGLIKPTMETTVNPNINTSMPHITINNNVDKIEVKIDIHVTLANPAVAPENATEPEPNEI